MFLYAQDFFVKKIACNVYQRIATQMANFSILREESFFTRCVCVCGGGGGGGLHFHVMGKKFDDPPSLWKKILDPPRYMTKMFVTPLPPAQPPNTIVSFLLL